MMAALDFLPSSPGIFLRHVFIMALQTDDAGALCGLSRVLELLTHWSR